MGIPATPPDPEKISPDVLRLNNIISARYVGGASLIKLKSPHEGFEAQTGLLKKIQKGYERLEEKVFIMGEEQQAVFQAGLSNYCNFGGHGSGR